jgi:hypothetical protein
MPALPEDIIDRLSAMERRLRQLSTAVNTRPPLTRIAGGTVEIGDGGQLKVLPPGGNQPVLEVGALTGEEFGIALRRQTGQLALKIWNSDGTSTSLQPIRLYDPYSHEIVSDDINTGGLARPWLAMLPPQDTAVTRWPQTTATTWTTIARSYNVVWQPKMRLYAPTSVTSGSTGEIRVLVNDTQWGATVTAGTSFDHTDFVAANFGTAFENLLKVEIQGQVTSGTGSVHAQPQLMYGRQT